MRATDRPRDPSSLAKGIALLLDSFAIDPSRPEGEEVQLAIQLARRLQSRASELQTPQERRQQAELSRMMHNPGDKATLMQITDEAFRSQTAHRAAEQLIHILDVQGIPRFFGAFERTMLRGFQSFGAYLPGVAMPLVKERMHHETANVILPAEPKLLARHLQERHREGVRMNVNLLGEALLGERDAERRLQDYLAALQRPEVEVISVKISTIYSQISALARRHTVDMLCGRMELLYRAAANSQFVRKDGVVVPKFVYLDMEEYRDKELTAEVFMQTLSRPGMEQVQAGIALQAYIPDSYLTQQQINAWARQRVAAGGASVTIRLVKGANMEMERIESSLRGWPVAPYRTKLETDANYHRMLQEAMRPENLQAVRLGIASHNLFTIAYALVLASRASATEMIQLEMLEGMANHQRRALFELCYNVLLYAPACRQEDFISAIGYLIRRLDENTGPDNFLRHAFNITVDGETWQRLERQFVDSFGLAMKLDAGPRRTQNRMQIHTVNDITGRKPQPWMAYQNEPDTDWSLPINGTWAELIIAQWQNRCDDDAPQVGLEIGGAAIMDDREQMNSADPSRPGVVAARYLRATEQDIELAVATASSDPDDWRRTTAEERCHTLYHVASTIAARRGDLMGAMLAEGGKVFSESDPEVSEGIDFCRFYGDATRFFHEQPALQLRGKGVVVVVSPWNFPFAIPCGGVAAALAAGNNVILKPASDTVMIAFDLCRCFWDAGVPRTALQFAPCSGRAVAQKLVTHSDVEVVILTGGTATAQQMLSLKPNMNLIAETGGKNATIATALSDRDQVIKNVLHSAFSHSGQKCSATSLLILEDEVYHDPKFRACLVDAVESLTVGSAWDLPTKVGPLIRPPEGELEQGLKELATGEQWAVRPRLLVNNNPCLVSPGVKWGVQPGSITHRTEFFGPLLGVMRAGNLRDAIELVNATGYGLTSGLESLDEREHEIWKQGIRAGNLYINRPTTGAIVLRQPFGGMGKSSVGPGLKAGGPNYVVPLMSANELGLPEPLTEESSPRAMWKRAMPTASPLSTIREIADILELRRQIAGMRPELARPFQRDIRRTMQAIGSYAETIPAEFLFAADHQRLLGEDNFRRYLPIRFLRIRVHPDDSFFEIFARAAAARAAGCFTTVSMTPQLQASAANAVELLDQLTDQWAGAIEFLEETDEELARAICEAQTNRIRFAASDRVSTLVRDSAAATLSYLADAPVLGIGRVELLWYFQEQSLSWLYHRYGNVGERADETRR